MLRCGFYETDITPNLGNNVPGYYDPRFAETVLDPLYAHAFAVQNEEKTVIIIGLDALLIRKTDADKIRATLGEKLSIPASDISVSCTHNHTAGPVIEVDTYPADENYCAFLVSRAVDAGILAHQRLTEAKIGYAHSTVEGVSFNRRFRLKDGRVKMNPGFLNPDIVEPVDIIDPELSVLRVDFLNGSPMGMIANFALHLDTIGTNVYSADYPGVIRKEMKKHYGDQFGFVFFNGTCGNVNHFDVTKPREEQLEYSAIGEILSDALKPLFDSVETKDADRLLCTTSTFTGHQCRPTDEHIAKEDNLPNRRRMIAIKDVPPHDVPVEVWTALIGDTAVQMIPGEVFAQFGLRIKKESGINTMISTLSNQSIGYIYTKEAELQGGYEATPSSYVEMDSDTGYGIVDAALSNLKILLNK